jgi:hypothetical protein
MVVLLVTNGRRVEDSKALKLMKNHNLSFLFMPCWKTLVKVPEEVVGEAEALAKRLEELDETFRWKRVSSYLPDVQKQGCVLFVIYSPARDQAYKRGSYFKQKLMLTRFKRIEKGYFWVEEYPSNLHYKQGNEMRILPEDAYVIKEVEGSLL